MKLFTLRAKRAPIATLLVVLALVFWIAALRWCGGNEDQVEAGASNHGQARDHRASPHKGQQEATLKRTPEQAAAANPADRPLQLPDSALPLAQQLSVLETLAEQGNPEASCRLYLGVRRCSMVAQRMQRAEQMRSSLERGGALRVNEELMLDSVANALEQTRAWAAYCEGVQMDRLPAADTLVEGAIGNMSSRQKVLLAMARQDGTIIRLPRTYGAPAGLGGSSDYVYPQFLSDHAYAILREGIEHADPLALEGMIMMYAPSWIPGTEDSPRRALPNPREFVRHVLLMERVYGGDAVGPVVMAALARSLETMNPTQRDEVERQSEADARRWLAVTSGSGTANAQSRPQELDLYRDCAD